MRYQGQLNQDGLLDRVVFRGMRGGTFLDVGAHDGLSLNNTVFFERERGWTGICIEPNPDLFPALASSRRATCLNVAVAEAEATMPFLKIAGPGNLSMLSGLAASMSLKHADPDKRIFAKGGAQVTIEVPVRRLDTILADHGVSDVHYLSLDIENGEASALRSIDFGKVTVHAASIEFNRLDPGAVVAAAAPHLVPIARLKHDFLLLNPRSQFYAQADRLGWTAAVQERRRALLGGFQKSARRTVRTFLRR